MPLIFYSLLFLTWLQSVAARHSQPTQIKIVLEPVSPLNAGLSVSASNRSVTVSLFLIMCLGTCPEYVSWVCVLGVCPGCVCWMCVLGVSWVRVLGVYPGCVSWVCVLGVCPCSVSWVCVLGELCFHFNNCQSVPVSLFPMFRISEVYTKFTIRSFPQGTLIWEAAAYEYRVRRLFWDREWGELLGACAGVHHSPLHVQRLRHHVPDLTYGNNVSACRQINLW